MGTGCASTKPVCDPHCELTYGIASVTSLEVFERSYMEHPHLWRSSYGFVPPIHQTFGNLMASVRSYLTTPRLRSASNLLLAMSLPCSAAFRVPFHGLGVVLRDSSALLVEQAQIGLGSGISLFSSFAVPVHRLFVILSDPLTIQVHPAQRVCPLAFPCSAAFAVPFHCLFVILSDPHAIRYIQPRLACAWA